jgi:hypothetical protein
VPVESTSATTFRRLAIVISGGIGFELASERHWKSAVQFIPIVAVAVLVAATVATMLSRARVVDRATRVACVAVGLTGMVGVYEHVLANLRAAPLDYHYTDSWTTMSLMERWWAGTSKTVGHSPPLAPALLVLGGICLSLSLDS